MLSLFFYYITWYVIASPVGLAHYEFPLQDFFSILDWNTSDVLYDSCNTTHWCDCPKSGEKCMHYGTCCIDFYWKRYRPMDMTKYRKVLTEKASKQFECRYLFPYAKRLGHNTESYTMIESCRKDADIEDKKRCTEDDSST